jgi:ElaB/YqjD/DUF883 family membrane-anchored ribosome-binding protein
MTNQNSAEAVANEAVDQASAAAKQAAKQAAAAARAGYATAQEYSARGAEAVQGLAEDLREFVRREPWIAMAAAFAVGYTVARVMRRTTS